MRVSNYRRLFRLAPTLLVALLGFCAASAKPKPKPQAPDVAADIDLPEDVNRASLRVSAIDTIYELDLSIEQLNVLSALATETADTTARSPGTATPQFLTTLKSFQTALLEAKDDQQIAKLRNQVIDMVDSPDIHLDTDIVTIARARAKSPQFCAQLKASQIAAFLAVHAEEVSDPVELMMSTADALQEMHADAAQKNADADADSTIHETGLTVGYLIAGTDDTKAHAAAQRVAQWLQDSDKLSDAQFAAQRQSMEDSAKKIVGDIPPVQVLNNWMQDQIAVLLSNPQLPSAVEVVVRCRTQTN
jgi:hypothetical protein